MKLSYYGWLKFPGSRELRASWPLKPYQDNVRICASQSNVIRIPIDIETDTGPQNIKARIDSGACLNVISEQVITKLGIPLAEIHLQLPMLSLGDGRPMKLDGAVIMSVKCADHGGEVRTCRQTFFFKCGAGGSSVVLSIPWLAEINPILNFRGGIFHWPLLLSPIAELPPRPDQQSGAEEASANNAEVQNTADQNPTAQNPGVKTTQQPRRSERIDQLTKKRNGLASLDAMDIDLREEPEGPRKKLRR